MGRLVMRFGYYFGQVHLSDYYDGPFGWVSSQGG
jgi:hypothetical protein